MDICPTCKLKKEFIQHEGYYCETSGCEEFEMSPERKLLRQLFDEPDPEIIWPRHG